MDKNYSSISPSALSLLRMKALTPIPFAAEATALLDAIHIKMEDPLGDMKNQLGYWMRVLHFEHRYKSIDQLLDHDKTSNILELSSGFSFRGLYRALHEAVHYIDTDLREIIEMKKNLSADLVKQGQQMKGTLEYMVLNAVDEAAFRGIVRRYDNGPLAIVNEGLLMYLNMDEKTKLCRNIADALKERGGYWVTADVYVKDEGLLATLGRTVKEEKFFMQHDVEQNKFDSFDQAQQFFEAQGLALVREADIAMQDLAAFPKLMQLVTPEMSDKMPRRKIQATWMLQAIK